MRWPSPAISRCSRSGAPPAQRLESFRSAPAQNTPAAPVTSTTSRSLRAASSCAQAIISRISSAESALRRSGRSSVTVAMRPENSLRSCRYMLTLCYNGKIFSNDGVLKKDPRSMALERTLSIIKPDAVKKNVIGQILARFEAAGLRVAAARMMFLSRTEAEGFYAVHRGRPFFNDLVQFMTSGPVLVQVLEGDNAIAKNRELMGATDPKKAAKGTIRADFAASIDANAVHGSDGPETAKTEIGYFFPASEVFSR